MGSSGLVRVISRSSLSVLCAVEIFFLGSPRPLLATVPHLSLKKKKKINRQFKKKNS